MAIYMYMYSAAADTSDFRSAEIIARSTFPADTSDFRSAEIIARSTFPAYSFSAIIQKLSENIGLRFSQED